MPTYIVTYFSRKTGSASWRKQYSEVANTLDKDEAMNEVIRANRENNKEVDILSVTRKS